MITRMIVPVILSTAMLSTPDLAAGDKAAAMTPAEKCSALETQFDAAIKTQAKAEKAKEAKVMRTDGGKLCAGGKQSEGITKLEQAPENLGVKAKS